MAEPKAHDGSVVVVHVVKKGESLSKIADHYNLPNWQAIWLYNTQVRQVFLGDNPDVIRTGERLFIPRSPESYDKLIKKLQSLKFQMASVEDQELNALDANRNLYKADAVMLDFAGDVAKTLVTFGLKAADVAKAAKVAETATGQSKVAAQYLADREAQKFSEMLRDSLKDTVRGAAASKADEYRERATGKESSAFETANKTYATGKKVASAVAGYSMIAGKTILDAAEIVLDYVSPSNAANLWLKITTGETVEGTMDRMEQQVKAAVRRSLEQLDAKIAKYADERKTVYPPGGSTIGRYVDFPPLHISVARPR